MLTINPGLAAALLGGGIAGGAAAMAAISARPARALHVVPQIAYDTPGGPLVPQSDGSGVVTPAPRHRPGAPVVSYPSGRDAHPVGWADSPMTPPPSTAPLAPQPAVGGTAPPPSAATAGAVPAGRVGLDRDTLGAALDALTNFPGRHTTHAAHATATDHHNHDLDDERRTGLQAALTGSGPRLLLDVGMPGSDPVWLDLAATSGVGVGGPGAAAVTRTLLHRLLTDRRPVTVTAHHDTLAILLADDTAPDPISQALGGTAAPLSAAVISHPWLSLAASSFDILDTAYAEIQRRSHRPILPADRRDRRAAIRARGPPDDRPAVGDAGARPDQRAGPAAPRRHPRHRTPLRHHRHRARPQRHPPQRHPPQRHRPRRHRPSDTGTTLLVDPDHRVTHHIVRTGGVDHDTAGRGLTGTQLQPTSPAELRALLATALDATNPPGVHPPDADPPPRAHIFDDHPGAPHTPTAVPVPPAIPQELLPAPPAATPEPMVATAAASRPPATLTVFGETSLRYRAPSDTDAAVPGTRADTAPHDSTHTATSHPRPSTSRSSKAWDHGRRNYCCSWPSTPAGPAATTSSPPCGPTPRASDPPGRSTTCSPASAAPCKPPPAATTSTNSSSAPATNTGSTSTWSPPTTRRSCTPPPTSTTPTPPSGPGPARPSSTPTAAPWAGSTPAANGSSSSSSTPATATCAR